MKYQIGDLVHYNNEVVRLSAVHKDYVLVENMQEDYRIPITDLKPIPMGEFYLDNKNGFESYGHDHYCEHNGRRIHVNFGGFLGYSCTVENMHKGICVKLNNVKWIHQVQQAIRLCEIDKELEYDHF